MVRSSQPEDVPLPLPCQRVIRQIMQGVSVLGRRQDPEGFLGQADVAAGNFGGVGVSKTSQTVQEALERLFLFWGTPCFVHSDTQ